MSHNYEDKFLLSIFAQVKLKFGLKIDFGTLIIVRSLYSEHVESDRCAPCQAFTLRVFAWGKLNKLCVLVDYNFSLFLPFGVVLSKNCFVEHVTHL